MNSWLKKAVPAVAAGAMLTGCSFGAGGNQAEEQQSFKVMYYDEGQFFQEHGMLFSALYPNVDIQVASTQSIYRASNEGEEYDPEKAMQEFLEKEKPDVLMLSMDEYEKLSQEGKLYDMETLMVQDKIDMEGFVPGMVDYMKELGGGQLYGMPSGFSSNVLYYNKALFDKYNIEHPTDKMTWDQVINLAKQFPTEGDAKDRVYGMKIGYSGDLNEMSSTLAQSEGLNFVNPSTKTMTINTDGWKRVIETSLDAIKSDAFYYESRDDGMMPSSSSYEDYLMRNPFISNRLAMTIDGTYLMSQIKEAQNYIKEEGAVVSDWDIVTVPVSPQFPDQSSSVWYNNIFAISKDSPNVEAAWKFISYIASDEYARVKSKASYNYNFSVRTKYIKDDEGRHYEAFYLLKPMRLNQYKDYDKLPSQFSMMFYGMMNTEFQAIQNGSKSVEEALEYLDLKGSELLAEESMSQEELEEMMRKQWEEQNQADQAALDQAAGIVTEETAEEAE